MAKLPTTGATAEGDPQPRPRLYRPGYKVTKVPLHYDAQIQLSAVLRVVFPFVRSDPKHIVTATAMLCQRWRTRAWQLALAGWVPLAGHDKKAQLSNALGCPPAFVMTFEKARKKKEGKKRTDCCHLRTLCPFCWARESRQYWLRLEPLFFPQTKTRSRYQRTRVVDTGPPDKKSTPFTLRVKGDENSPRSPYDLVYRVFTFVVPTQYDERVFGAQIIEPDGVRLVSGVSVVRDGLAAWFDSRLRGKPDDKIHRLYECRALLKAAGPAGGLLEAIQYRRRPEADSAGRSWWDVEVHQLLLAVDGDQVPKRLHPFATGHPMLHMVIHKPNRRTLAKYLGKTLRYPKLLIDPDTPLARAIEHLNARRGRRLVASYGRFRNKKLK